MVVPPKVVEEILVVHLSEDNRIIGIGRKTLIVVKKKKKLQQKNKLFTI